MNDTLFVSLHAGLYAQYENEKKSLARCIENCRHCSPLDRDHWCETLKYWMWALRQTRMQFRSIREKRKSIESVQTPVAFPEYEYEVTVSELAQKLGKTRAVIWGRIKSGVYPAPLMIGRKAYWPKSQIENHTAATLWKGANK